MAFFVPITCESNNMVEAIATEFGGKWCNCLRYTNFALELDSMVIANMLKNRNTNNLKIKMIIDRTINIIEIPKVTVKHSFKEKNQVADSLAKLAATTIQSLICHTYQQLPKNAKGLSVSDSCQV